MERTIKVIIEGPVQSYSFYGDKAREIVKAIKVLHNDWDVIVGCYNENNIRGGYHDDIVDSLIASDYSMSPDIWIQVGHPIRFRQNGKVNIGVTTLDPPLGGFIAGCGHMDVILTYSEYSKNNILKFNIDRPIVVLPEYSIMAEEKVLEKLTNNDMLKSVETDWNFLCEGYFESTDSNVFGGKNKDNITFIVRSFLEAFADCDNSPGIILNVRGDKASILDKTRLEKKINNIRDSIKYEHSLPPVYLINGDLSLDQRYHLYTNPKIKAMISVPQRSDSVQKELDFCLTTRKPIIYSSFAAQKEVLSYEGNIGIGGNIKDIKETGLSVIDTFTTDINLGMYDMFIRYNKQYELSQKNIKDIINNYSSEQFSKELDAVIEKYNFKLDSN